MRCENLKRDKFTKALVAFNKAKKVRKELFNENNLFDRIECSIYKEYNDGGFESAVDLRGFSDSDIVKAFNKYKKLGYVVGRSSNWMCLSWGDVKTP